MGSASPSSWPSRVRLDLGRTGDLCGYGKMGVCGVELADDALLLHATTVGVRSIAALEDKHVMLIWPSR